jgi:hypothetical protein
VKAERAIPSQPRGFSPRGIVRQIRDSRKSHRGLKPRGCDNSARIATTENNPFAAAADAAAVLPVRASRTSLATLLASHILHDGETVILLLRPSIWFLLVSGFRFYTAAAALMGVVAVIGGQTHRPIHSLMETGGAIIALRLMWAVLQWMGRLYVLTDLRTLTLTGVFTIDVIDCPLRKVERTRLVQPVWHRSLGVGSVVLTPTDEAHPVSWWYLIDHPTDVLKQIDATIHRARQGGE